MNWKFEAIEKLKEYTARKNAITSIPEEIKRLEEDAQRIRAASTDATPVQGGGSTREDMLLSNIVLREELQRRLSDAKRWVDIVDAGLAVLSDEDRLVLDRFYIHPMRGNLERLCNELGLEEAKSVYRRKDKALRKFTLAIYGCEES